jgi:hypothetical protein
MANHTSQTAEKEEEFLNQLSVGAPLADMPAPENSWSLA